MNKKKFLKIYIFKINKFTKFNYKIEEKKIIPKKKFFKYFFKLRK